MFVHSQLQSLMPSRASHCFQHKQEFLPDQEYVSFLVMTEKGWKREDHCSECWEKKSKEQPQEGLIWRGKIPKKRKKIYSQDEKALLFFREEEDEKMKFVLALYLERKKTLLKRGGHKNQLCFESESTGEIFSVEKINLTKDELDHTVASLLKRLNE